MTTKLHDYFHTPQAFLLSSKKIFLHSRKNSDDHFLVIYPNFYNFYGILFLQFI